MPANRADVWKLLTYIQDDLRQTQAKLVEVRSMLAAGAMNHDDTSVTCPECRSVFGGERALAEHRYTSHDIGSVCLNCGLIESDDHKCRPEILAAIEA